MEENDKTLTPPRNPPSNVLLITNLVRPFTLPQLKEMLQRTGNLQDIWVDKIKSRCIAKVCISRFLQIIAMFNSIAKIIKIITYS